MIAFPRFQSRWVLVALIACLLAVGSVSCASVSGAKDKQDSDSSPADADTDNDTADTESDVGSSDDGVAEEKCDGLDDDEDGSVDEGCSCEAGKTLSCFPGAAELAGVGECVAGQQKCKEMGEFSVWGSCEGAVGPTQELCDDGLDNDCDEKTDSKDTEDGCGDQPDDTETDADTDADTDTGVDTLGTCQGGWLDSKTNLCWEDPPSGTYGNWSESIAYCDNLDRAGHTDWRLPSISELRSLIRGCKVTMTGGACGVTDSCTSKSCWSEACDNGCVSNVDPYWDLALHGELGIYYSSTPFEDVATHVWAVSFHEAKLGWYIAELTSYFARCVRDGP